MTLNCQTTLTRVVQHPEFRVANRKQFEFECKASCLGPQNNDWDLGGGEGHVRPQEVVPHVITENPVRKQN